MICKKEDNANTFSFISYNKNIRILKKRLLYCNDEFCAIKCLINPKFSILVVLFFIITFNIFAIDIKALSGPFNFKLSEPIVETQENKLVLIATLTISIASKHHIYKESFSITCNENFDLQYSLPKTKLKFDSFLNKEVEVLDEGNYGVILNFTPKKNITSSFTITVNYQGCSNNTCFLPEEVPIELQISSETIDLFSKAYSEFSKPEDNKKALNDNSSNATSNIENNQNTQNILEVKQIQPDIQVSAKESLKHADNSINVSPNTENDITESSYDRFMSGNVGEILKNYGISIPILLSFLAGFLVSLTPCVYPLIPVTLSIIGIMNQFRSIKQGFLLSISYVLGLSITYSLLGVLVAIFGAHVRSILHGSVFQLLIAILFVILGLSMFDVFSFHLPSNFSNIIKLILIRDQKKDLFRVFCVGLASGLMASPCVAAPLAGILTFIASTANVFYGFVLLFSFAWGMGIILVIVGTFAGLLEALPKSGNWMISIKEIYGFLMFGTAVYFASPVLGYPWSAFLTSVLLASFAGYLGLFTPVSSIEAIAERVKRAIAVVILSVACAFAISAACKWGGLCFLPPNFGSSALFEVKQKVKWYNSLDEAKLVALRENKPIFVDFRAEWCSVCKELEQNVFTDIQILEIFEKYVLVKIDITNVTEHNKILISKYNVVGLPTLIFLKSDGTEISDLRVMGYISKQNLAKRLQIGLNR